MDAFLINLAGLGIPGVFMAAVIWHTRRLDAITERTIKILETDRDYWMNRAKEAETTLLRCREERRDT